jgi:hypothetical protein
MYSNGLVYVADLDCGISVFEYTATSVNPGSGMSLNALHLYPVPTTGEVVITFNSTQTGPVNIAVYDHLGRMVHTIISEIRPGSEQPIRWDGCDASGRKVSPGYYVMTVSGHGGIVCTAPFLVTPD